MWGLLGLAVACRGVQSLPDPGDERPTLTVVDQRLRRIDFEEVDAHIVIAVDNPWPVRARASHVWAVRLDDEAFAEGSSRGPSIAPGARSEVSIPLKIRYDEARAEVGALDDTLSYDLQAGFAFETVSGPLTIPVEHRGTLPVLRSPRLELATLRLLGLDQTDLQIATMLLDVEVASVPDATVEWLEYRLRFDEAVVASGRAKKEDLTAGNLTIPVEVALVNLTASLASDIRNRSAVDVRFTATVRAATSHGPVRLDVDRTRLMQLR